MGLSVLTGLYFGGLIMVMGSGPEGIGWYFSALFISATVTFIVSGLTVRFPHLDTTFTKIIFAVAFLSLLGLLSFGLFT